MDIDQYIAQHYDGSQAAFAHACGVTTQAVSKWKSTGNFIIVDGYIYSMRRKLPPLPDIPVKKRRGGRQKRA
ncbi:TPA: helix-turn-helix domain-containing protein [Enterobacter hormaechei subsp. xiangfangensis]|nr:helix-turn-helix domain-containing protein [Enterobacter hormaechei subsp. xiangfangensis]HAV1890551.1 helix-turn-helix domain-containing protein [Enterobacter hormaechei subsp. xiangfangensis]